MSAEDKVHVTQSESTLRITREAQIAGEFHGRGFTVDRMGGMDLLGPSTSEGRP